MTATYQTFIPGDRSAFIESAEVDLIDLPDATEFSVVEEATASRRDRLLRSCVEDCIVEHTSGITDRATAEAVSLAYDERYLMGLPIPFDGLQELATELIKACSNKGYTHVPTTWRDFSEGIFPWHQELENH